MEAVDEEFAALVGADEDVHAAVYGLESAAAVVNRAQRRLWRWIIACDLHRSWIEDDCRDLSHWVALRLGISMFKARRWINCAWKLEELPRIADAYECGELSTDKVVELTRIATPDNEAEMLRWARRVAVGTIRDRADCAARIAVNELRRAEKERSLKWWIEPDKARMSLYGSFPIAEGLKVTTAIDRLAGKMAVAPDEYDADPEATVDARRADALACLASAAIDGDADADRATVVVHAELSALVKREGNAAVDSGLPLHPSVTGRILCDCRYQPVVHDDKGMVVGIGKTSRLIPRWLRRQAEYRDHHRCTFPNCGSKAYLQVHHVVPWPNGPTELPNLILVCWVHHKLVHESGWHVTMQEDQTTRWFRPDWRPYEPRPAPAPPVRLSDASAS